MAAYAQGLKVDCFCDDKSFDEMPALDVCVVMLLAVLSSIDFSRFIMIIEKSIFSPLGMSIIKAVSV